MNYNINELKGFGNKSH